MYLAYCNSPGEEIEITVSGRLAARDDIANAFTGRPDLTWDHDRDLVDDSVIDPWEPLA